MKKQHILKVFNELQNIFAEDIDALANIEFLRAKVEELKEEQSSLSSSDNFPVPLEVIDVNAYALFSDGACRGNPGPGSWGAMAQNARGEVLYEASGIDLRTTNNRMELEGAIQSIRLLIDYADNKSIFQHPIFLYSDSKYVVDGIHKWVPNWKKRGWKKADKKSPENLELWKALEELVGKFLGLQFVWVKGHNGHPQNERCDTLANEALDLSGH